MKKAPRKALLNCPPALFVQFWSVLCGFVSIFAVFRRFPSEKTQKIVFSV
jgi:hypothetical protein